MLPEMFSREKPWAFMPETAVCNAENTSMTGNLC